MAQTAEVKVSLTEVEPVKELLREGRQLVADQAAVIAQLTDALTTIRQVCVGGMETGVSVADLLTIESIARHALREAATA